MTLIVQNKPLIIKDTREQRGFDFPEDDIFAGTVVEKLNYGDYSIQNLTHLIFIERKASTSEISKNVFEDRFTRLLENAKQYKYRYIIMEFDWDDVINFPLNSGIPKHKQKYLKIKSAFLQSYLTKISIDYGFHIVYAHNAECAEKFTYNLLKNIWRKENAK